MDVEQTNKFEREWGARGEQVPEEWIFLASIDILLSAS
jgi:hypothetical protein